METTDYDGYIPPAKHIWLAKKGLPVMKESLADPCYIYIPFSGQGLAGKQRAIADEIDVGMELLPQERLHMTLLWADHCSEAALAAIISGLAMPIKFGIEIASLDILKDALVWVAVADPALMRLQSDLYRRALNEGVELSEYSLPSAWIPHVSIAYDLVSKPESLPQIEPFKLQVDRFIVGRYDYEKVYTVHLARAMGDRVLVEQGEVLRHGEHEGQEGREGQAGGSKPGFTHGGAGSSDFKSRVVSLMKEKVGISDVPERAAWIGPAGEYIGKDADHQQTAMDVMAELRPDEKLGVWDATLEMIKAGLIRHTGFRRQHAFETDKVENLTTEQKDAIASIMTIAKAKVKDAEFVIDEFVLDEERPRKYVLHTLGSKQVLDLLGLSRDFWDTTDPIRVKHYTPTEVTKSELMALMRGETIIHSLLRRAFTIADGPFAIRRHSRKRCMNCKKPPEVAVHWADGRGMAWFCLKDFESWMKEEDRELTGAWFVKDGEVPEDVREIGSKDKVRKLGQKLSTQEILKRLKSLRERHGEHEGQEGREGKAGGSKPGFTHGSGGASRSRITTYDQVGDAVRSVKANWNNKDARFVAINALQEDIGEDAIGDSYIWKSDDEVVGVVNISKTETPFTIDDLQSLTAPAIEGDNLTQVFFLSSNQRGMGATMMQWAVDLAAKRGHGLWIYSEPEATGFYEKIGMNPALDTETNEPTRFFYFSAKDVKFLSSSMVNRVLPEVDDDDEPESGAFASPFVERHYTEVSRSDGPFALRGGPGSGEVSDPQPIDTAEQGMKKAKPSLEGKKKMFGKEYYVAFANLDNFPDESDFAELWDSVVANGEWLSGAGEIMSGLLEDSIRVKANPNDDNVRAGALKTMRIWATEYKLEEFWNRAGSYLDLPIPPKQLVGLSNVEIEELMRELAAERIEEFSEDDITEFIKYGFLENPAREVAVENRIPEQVETRDNYFLWDEGTISINDQEITERHYAPTHPGTGTDQSVHAGNGKRKGKKEGESTSFGLSEKEAQEWGTKHFPSKYDDETMGALYEYKTTLYENINYGLRKGGYIIQNTPVLRRFVAKIDEAMEMNTVPQDIVAYRGMNLEHIVSEGESLVGTTFTDNAFVSTSLAAFDAQAMAEGKDFPALAKIQVPAGTHATYMDFSQMRDALAEEGQVPNEEELLLDRGLTFRVVSYQEADEFEGTVPQIELEIVNER